MALTGQQIGDLNLLNKRIAEGYKANQTDLANLEYAKSKGYVYNPMPDNYAKVAGPSGLAGLGESDIYRLGKDIYSLQVPDTLTMDEMNQSVTIPQAEQLPNFNADSLMNVNTGTDYLNNLIKQQMTSTPSQAEYDATRGKIAEVSEKQKTAQRDLQEQKWEQFKLQENFDEINKLMPQIAKAQADYMKFQEEYQNLPYRSRIIGGTADRMARQQAVEMAGLSAIAQAYQGNIDLARNITQDALNAQYQDYANYFNSLSFQLSAIERNLNQEERNKANALQIAIDERQRQLAEERTQKENIMNLGLTIAQAGGSSEIVSQILKASSPERAIELAVESGVFQMSTDSNWTILGTNEAGETVYYDAVSKSFKTESSLLGDELGDKALSSPSGKVYDMSTYATDTAHTQKVQEILNKMGRFKTIDDIDRYIKSVQPNSPITGKMIAEAAALNSVGWEELTALIQHESNLGTSNVARNNNNVGGITWNSNFPASAKGTARPGSEGGNYVKFESLQAGVNSVAYELKKRRIEIDRSVVGSGVNKEKLSKDLTATERKDIESIKTSAPYIMKMPYENQMIILRNISGNLNRAEFVNWFENQNKIMSRMPGKEYPLLSDIQIWQNEKKKKDTEVKKEKDDFDLNKILDDMSSKEEKKWWQIFK